ncbi:hypothetical protein GCM10008018_13990 [Paenibacillus marchantiophytorum]|uniref:HTH araC/xylS-type domain-containing protein n=1 Tax=Paenibacillus marchantiophytorum TaxID=1619310 RepID=A0ABQ2BRG0_9BACL|nr:helix-turn-helix domain-containing protein [Paenibacillus marchantiophytorum]GGI45811.1 hypothetical protein GCM10008018_13990 [Paenibacillus marchantiophytorum]
MIKCIGQKRRRIFLTQSFSYMTILLFTIGLSILLYWKPDQYNLLRLDFIRRLLQGRLDNQFYLEESLKMFEIRFSSDIFAVFTLHIEAHFYVENNPCIDEKEKIKRVRSIVSTVAADLINVEHVGYVVEINDLLACMVNLRSIDPTDHANVSKLRKMAIEMQQLLKNKYQIDLTISISSLHRSILGISDAYQESLNALEHKLILGSKQIISYTDIRQDPSDEPFKGYYYPLMMEQVLINAIKAGDYAKAKKTLDAVVERNLNIHPVTLPFARCLKFNLLSTVAKALCEISDPTEDEYAASMAVIEHLTESESIQDMLMQLTNLIKKICDSTLTTCKSNRLQIRQQDLKELTQNVLAFIQEHHRDSDLNITKVGHYFEIKSTYLSKLFKDQTGEGLLDVINKVRIAHAKELILVQKHSLNDISNLVGFSEVNTFFRLFKKYEGITPGKYREISIKSTLNGFLIFFVYTFGAFRYITSTYIMVI